MHNAHHRVIPPSRVFPLRMIVLVALLAACAGCGKNATERLREKSDHTEKAETLLFEGRYEQSLAELKDLLAGTQEPGMDSVLAESRYIAAQCDEQLGRYEDALANFRSSMEYAHSISDQRLERLNKYLLSRFYFATGDFALARVLASEAAATARVFADSSRLYDALFLSADADGRSGEVDRSLRTIADLERMVPASSGVDRRIGLMRLRFETLLRAGRDAEVRETLSRWRGSLRDAPDKRSLMMAAYSSGKFQDHLSHPDSALAFYSESLTLFESPDTLFAPDLLASLGNVAYQLRHYADAERYYADALDRARAAGNGVQEPLLKLAVAACDWNIGKRQQGTLSRELVARCSAILDQCRERRIPDGTALALFLLGVVTEQGEKGDSAMILYRSALAVAQQSSFRSWESSPMRRLSEVILAGERSDWHTPMMRIAAQQGDAASVFGSIERKNLDDIGTFFLESSVRPPDGGIRASIEELQWKRRLAARSEREIEEELALGRNGNAERAAALTVVSPRLAAESDRASAAFNTSPSNLRWILTEREVPLRAVQDTLSEGSALLEFALAPKVLTIVVVKRDTVVLRNVPVEMDNLIGMISEYNRIIGDEKISNEGAPMQSAAAVRRMGDLADELSNLLVDPVMADLRQADTLYVVSPAEFGWLPFHTLRGGNGGGRGEGGGSSAALLERRTVRYLPSAAILFCSRPPERFVSTVAGVGYPGSTNWDVEYELKDIRSFYDKARMLFDTAATVIRLSQLSADVVHIAAEFSLAASGPDRSGVFLSDGLTPFGQSRVPLGTLAALPPPQTLLLSSISATPGVLNRYVPALFLANGTRTVIATMWRGDRKAKRYFGEIFYTNLMTGLPAGDAYRSAALALVKKGEYAAQQRWGLYFQYGR